MQHANILLAKLLREGLDSELRIRVRLREHHPRFVFPCLEYIHTCHVREYICNRPRKYDTVFNASMDLMIRIGGPLASRTAKHGRQGSVGVTRRLRHGAIIDGDRLTSARKLLESVCVSRKLYKLGII